MSLSAASFVAAGIRPVTNLDWLMFALCPTAGLGNVNGPANWQVYDWHLFAIRIPDRYVQSNAAPWDRAFFLYR